MDGSKEECTAQLYKGIKRFFRKGQSKALNVRELHLVNIEAECTQIITRIISAHKSVIYNGKGTIWVAKDGENPFATSSCDDSGENASASASAASTSVPLARGDDAVATHVSAGQQKAALTAPLSVAPEGAFANTNAASPSHCLTEPQSVSSVNPLRQRPRIMPIPMPTPHTVEELLALPPSNHTLDVWDNACVGKNHCGVIQIGTNEVLTQSTCNQILCND